MTTTDASTWQRLLRRAVLIEREEIQPALAAFTFVFIAMAAYYLMRPLRDAMASDWSNAEIAALWNMQLVLSGVSVAVYGYLCARLRFARLVPGVYLFFAMSFAAFYAGAGIAANHVLIDKAFYLWVSLFSLFHVSVFWSLMGEVFTKSQSQRLFAFLAGGSSAGAALGPLFAGLFVGRIGVDNLLLIAALMLFAGMPLVLYLQRLAPTGKRADDISIVGKPDDVIGGSPLAGFSLFLRNPFLLGIGAFILLLTAINGLFYLQQTEVLRVFPLETRAAILGYIAAAVNVLTPLLGVFATGRLVRWLGVSAALALMPLLVAVGLILLALVPAAGILMVMQTLRQAGNYGITRPAREMLFTHVDRQTRFKAKPVADVVIYRGGDVVTISILALMTDALGMGFAAMAGVGAVVALIWAGIGVKLGRMFDRSS
ncbi:MAG: MFS transporter [Gammaproteobacteria bacterium]|nr:MFS transporter [Gammaproteobacteria bacterium]